MAMMTYGSRPTPMANGTMAEALQLADSKGGTHGRFRLRRSTMMTLTIKVRIGAAVIFLAAVPTSTTIHLRRQDGDQKIPQLVWRDRLLLRIHANCVGMKCRNSGLQDMWRGCYVVVKAPSDAPSRG